MRRRALAAPLALVAGGWATAVAQPPPPLKEGPWVIPLTVSPAAEPRPALKYRLLPEVRDLQSGNQIQAFYKCFFEQNSLFYGKEAVEKRQRWLDAPLKDLAGEKELVGYGGAAVSQARYAARLDTVDWQITNQAKADGILLLLPDVQQMRMLAAVLKVRVRGEIARGEFAEAVKTLQVMFALGRTFNEHPTLIGHLVGIAITQIALGEVEEFVPQPGAPNLFWSLTDLPAPFIDLRKGGQGEKLFLVKEFEPVRAFAPLAEGELAKLVKRLDELSDLEGQPDKPSAWYAKRVTAAALVAAARGRLTAAGHPAADVAKLPALQVLLTDDFARYEEDLEDFTRWTNLPFWQTPPDLGAQKPADGPLGRLLPAWTKVLHARTRLQQQVAFLTTVEAVRAHAAGHGGALPATLAEIKLPLPVDAYAGRPLGYEVKGATATLRGNPPPDLAKQPAVNRVYEITVRK